MSPPAGSSTLITSAPRPASTSVQNGPASARVRSMTRSPASGPSAGGASGRSVSADTVSPSGSGSDSVLDEAGDRLAERLLVPGPAVDVVGRDGQHRDPGRLQPPDAEVVVLAEAHHAVDLVLPGLLDMPGGRPGWHPQLIADRHEAGGERAQRVAAVEVTRVPVGGQAQVHGPDEDGAVLLLETLVEAETGPEPAAQPHQPDPLGRAGGGAGRRALLHLGPELGCGVPAPGAASVPL